IWANKATTMVGLMAPFFALLVPMLDTGMAILRRWVTGQPLFVGDQGHIHHRLVRRGLTPRNAVFVLYGVAGVGGILSLLLADLRQRHSFDLVVLLFAALVAVGVQQLRFGEFSELGARLGGRAAAPLEQQRAYCSALANAADHAQVWDALVRLGQALGCDGLEFRAGTARNPQFEDRVSWGAGGSPREEGFRGWSCRIPLGTEGDLGLVTLWRGFEGEFNPVTLWGDGLPARLNTVLSARLRDLRPPPALAAAAPGAALPR